MMGLSTFFAGESPLSEEDERDWIYPKGYVMEMSLLHKKIIFFEDIDMPFLRRNNYFKFYDSLISYFAKVTDYNEK